MQAPAKRARSCDSRPSSMRRTWLPSNVRPPRATAPKSPTSWSTGRTSGSTATIRPCSTPMVGSRSARRRAIRRPRASCGWRMAVSMRSPTSAAVASSGRLGTKRQIIYDDFAAVAKDLIATHVTSPRRLGIRGGSNGGLLMGVEFTQHPELWHAVIIDVPLLDMISISKIAAGASWEGEYGSVEDDPAVRAFWEKTSPYQNLKAGTAYPTPFIFTTTKDDRVGPQHARKFAARMEEMGLPFYYYENTEGGHAAGANLRQTAHTNALEMTYLTRKLMDPEEPKK